MLRIDLAAAPPVPFGIHAAKQPTVIVMMADDSGCGDGSCCGAEGIKTPLIDHRVKALDPKVRRKWRGSWTASSQQDGALTERN